MIKINKTLLLKRIGYLEFVNDQMASELKYLDALLKEIGFVNGLETVKLAALEVKEEKSDVIESDVTE